MIRSESFRYERKHEPPLKLGEFARRVAWHTFIAAALVGASLTLGIAGYVFFERLTVVDAFLNAAMLLGGMGPVAELQTTGGKVFAGTYALFAGLIFVAAAGIIIAPLVHRVVHGLHWEDDE